VDAENHLTVLEYVSSLLRKPVAKREVLVEGLSLLVKDRHTREDLVQGSVALVTDAPVREAQILETARRLNGQPNLVHVEGYYTHPRLDDLFSGCNLLVDESRYGLANKLLLNRGFRAGIPVIRGFSFEEDGQAGCTAFTYLRGRAWQELEQLVSPTSLPAPHQEDGVLALVAAGVKHELIVLPGVNHSFIGKTPGQTRDANLKALAATFQFIDQTIGNASSTNR